MNKVLAFFMVLLPILACAQTVGTFSNQHANRDNIRVELLKKDNKPYYVRFDAQTKRGYGEVWIKYKDLAKFRQALIDARDKYVEWSQVADANNVKNFRKDIPVKFPKPIYWWEIAGERFYDDYTGWKMIFSATDNFRFAFMLAETKHMKNRYITENYEIVFSCVDDFNSLIDLLDPAKVDAVVGDPVDESLFK